MKTQNDLPFGTNMLVTGTAACIADLTTFPLDTAKVRMQIAGEGRSLLMTSTEGSVVAIRAMQPGLFQTISNVIKQEGVRGGYRSLYGGLSAGLQRQMCFSSIRLGLYETVKSLYASILDGDNKRSSSALNVGIKISAGITTGGLAVLCAQPTDVVKIRLQAGNYGKTTARYKSTWHAYKSILGQEGVRGLWRGTFPNVSRNAIVNVTEIVCYDIVKESILSNGLMYDGVICHFTAAAATGLFTTIAATPVDVVKTRYMNSSPGEYKGAIDTAVRMLCNEGAGAFYKGFIPSFTRLVSWNIVLWVTYEQIKIQAQKLKNTE